MQLKWDSGLASRGKWKGKKTFETESSPAQPASRIAVPRRPIEVRFANGLGTQATKHSRRKRKKSPGEQSFNANGDTTKRPKTSHSGSSTCMSLALIAPEIPVLSRTPSAPVPAILFRDNNAHLFSHYLNHVAKVTVVSNNQKNPFKSIICPMSFESPLIMSNVLSIAAANLANRFPEYGVVAYHHLNNALSELKVRLADPSLALSEVTLAGVLGQVSCQLHFGDVASWRVHLTAARDIVNALGGPRSVLAKRPDFRFYIQHLAWLDTLAATTSSTKQIGEADYWEALLQSIQDRSTTYGMQDLMGCPEELLEIIAEMTRRFDETVSEISDKEEDGAIIKLVSVARQGERDKLGKEYSEKLDALEPKQNIVTSSHALNEVFRLAAKIYLSYRIMHKTCWTASLQSLLREALGLLDIIPAESQEEMALPWPLFIMGSICIYAREQKIVRTRYASMIKYMGFGNIHRCMELLEEVWKGWKEAEIRSCPARIAGQPWDERDLGRKRWEDVMREKGYDLLLA